MNLDKTIRSPGILTSFITVLPKVHLDFYTPLNLDGGYGEAIKINMKRQKASKVRMLQYLMS